MTPTVGRIVHYTSLGDKDGKYPPQVVAAIITKVEWKPDSPAIDECDHTVSLKAFYPAGFFDMPDVPFSYAKAGSELARGRWTWPERA
jgi:hypothetical protein